MKPPKLLIGYVVQIQERERTDPRAGAFISPVRNGSVVLLGGPEGSTPFLQRAEASSRRARNLRRGLGTRNLIMTSLSRTKNKLPRLSC